jgi:hypothetical protein
LKHVDQFPLAGGTNNRLVANAAAIVVGVAVVIFTQTQSM